MPQCEGYPFEADPLLFWTEQGVTDYQFGMDPLEIKYFDPQGGFTNADPADIGHCGAFEIRLLVDALPMNTQIFSTFTSGTMTGFLIDPTKLDPNYIGDYSLDIEAYFVNYPASPVQVLQVPFRVTTDYCDSLPVEFSGFLDSNGAVIDPF